jgi:hypothetical protein
MQSSTEDVAEFKRKVGCSYLRLGPGCLIGTGVISSKCLAEGAWEWKDEIVSGQPSVGAVTPASAIVASDIVKVR